MTTRQRKRSKLRRLILPLGSLAVLGYFGYHSFNGDYGIWSRERMEREAITLQAQVDQLKHQNQAQQVRSDLLNPKNLDPDMIDERARVNLNMLKADELVIDLAAPQQNPG